MSIQRDAQDLVSAISYSFLQRLEVYRRKEGVCQDSKEYTFMYFVWEKLKGLVQNNVSGFWVGFEFDRLLQCL